MCWREERGLSSCEGADVILELKDIRQHDDYSCGDACVDVVIRFMGIRTCVSVLTMANAVQGVGPETCESLLRRAGLSVLSGAMTVDDLRHLTKSGRPVLCPTSILGGHWVVVAGVARGKVHFHDPVSGPSTLKIAEWDEKWHDESRSGHAFRKWGICGYLGN